LKIALVETAPFGGLLHYAVQFADALAERGHEVDVIAPRDNELVAHRGAARMRPVLTAPVQSPGRVVTGRARVLAKRAGTALRLSRAWTRILVEARRGNYEVVVLNSDLGLTLTASFALALTAMPGGPRVADVCHNVRTFNRWGGEDMFASPPLFRVVESRLLRRFDVVFVHGERSKEELEETEPGVRATIIPHGDERLFTDGPPPPPAEEERILFFGDWRKVKGLPALMEAFDELVRRRSSARLTIAGRPAPYDFDPDIVRRWAAGHGGRVTVVDRYVPLEEVSDIFAAARVVVTPYVVGYQSGVVHLAMTMGRAVVATDIGDLGSSVIDGETGRVIPPNDRDALVAALEQVIADPELANRFGAEGRRRVLDRSGWETVAELVEAALGSLNGSRRR
jgi:glycosyltransferase involved in cell wall biosynthesis